MGIRVHKIIGYGIVDLEHNESTMTDKRINWDILKNLCEKAEKARGGKFIKWYNNNFGNFSKLQAKKFHLGYDRLLRTKKFYVSSIGSFISDNKNWNLSECLVHNDEYGFPNVIVFIPPIFSKQWKRYDDTIDWLEETQNYGQQNRFQLLDRDLYPYIDKMICFRNQKKNVWNKLYKDQPKIAGFVWDKKKLVAMDRSEYNRLIGKWSPDTPAKAGKKLIKHLTEDWKPSLPKDLIAVLYWFKDCFVDIENIIDSIYPVLYVYWS